MGEGGAHKLLAEFDGEPLVRFAAGTALTADATSVIVVTGHRRGEIEAALSGWHSKEVNRPTRKMSETRGHVIRLLSECLIVCKRIQAFQNRRAG